MCKTIIASIALLLACAPLGALAKTVDASLIPDGTYVAKVEKVPDARHVTILMSNGMETTVSAMRSVNFSTVKPGATMKLTIESGKVPVFGLLP